MTGKYKNIFKKGLHFKKLYNIMKENIPN